MSDVRAVDSTAAAYQTSTGANPPAPVTPAKGEELFSINPLWLVVAAALLFFWWLGRRSNRATPATATAPAPVAAAPAPAAAPAAATLAAAPQVGILGRWFNPPAGVLENFTTGERDDIIAILLMLAPSTTVDPSSLKKSFKEFFKEMQKLQNNGNFELRRYSIGTPDSPSMEDLINRFIRKNTSLQVTGQTTAQERDEFERKLENKTTEADELKDKVTAAKQEATASGEEAKQARTDLIAYRNSITEIAKSERDMIRAGKRADSSAVLEGFLMAIDRQPQSRSAQTPRNDSRPNESGGNRGDRNRNRDRGSRPAPRPEGETAGA